MAQTEALTIAIDLGTAYTRAGIFNGEKCILFHDERGKTAVPSYVAFTDSRVLVGHPALKHAEISPTNTVFDILRLLGRSFSDPAFQADMKLWPFSIVQDNDGITRISVEHKGNVCQFLPEEICAFMLSRMKQIAEFHLHSNVTSAVITIPANFNHYQRMAVKYAASIANLHVKRLISASVSAALFYSLDRKKANPSGFWPFSSGPTEFNQLVFDLGAGTLDVSIVSVKEDKCIVRATVGDIHLGGQELDKILMDYVIDNCLKKQQIKRDIYNNKGAIGRLRKACERAKQLLLEGQNFRRDISVPISDDGCFKATITRSKFYELTQGLVSKCVKTINTCINEAKIDKSRNLINDVILVGGGAKNPMVLDQVCKYFRNDLTIKNNAEVAVVYGAAMQAFLLSGSTYKTLDSSSLIDATSFSFGIRTVEDMALMIPRNTQLPARNDQGLFNYNHRPQNLVLEVYEGERLSTRENITLSKFELPCNIRSGHGSTTCKCVVCFEMDADDVLAVSVVDTSCETEARFLIGNIDHNLPALHDSRRRVWDGLTYQEGENTQSNSNTTTGGVENSNPSSVKEKRVKEMAKLGELAIGIDFGTTSSCVGVWNHGRGRGEIIENEYGSRTSLSCVAFTEVARFIGDAAKQQLTMNPTNTIINVKRLIGRHLDRNVQNYIKTLPFEVKEGQSGRPLVVVQYKGEEKLFMPEEITGMLLRKLKEQAEQHTKSEIKNVVITVPSYFSDSQRKATREAGLIAGLNVMQLLNETTAAAITYYLHKSSLESFKKKNVLVFDLGGGTFDVSVVRISNEKIQVLAVLGDSNLGGEDFDTNLVNHFVEQFKSKNKKALKGKNVRDNPRSIRRLSAACEKAKRILSTVPKTNIDLDALYEGIDFNATITKEEFELLNVELIARCMESMKRCLANAKMDISSIDDVILIGGSTRIPMLQQELQKFFGKELCKSINPDEAVAHGAAVLASKLSGNEKFQGLEIHDVTSISFGIETMSGAMQLLVPSYSRIPLQVEQIFTTCKDNQLEIPISLFECELSRVNSKNGLIGNFTLSGIPPQPKGSPKVCVNLNIDSSGILNLSAYDVFDSEKKSIAIKEVDSGNLTKEEIENMMREAEKFKADDDEQKKQAEAMNALENFAFRMKEMANNPEMGARKKEIEEAANETLDWLDAQHNAKIEKINEKKRQLESLCDQQVD
ncbi:hypothetical protein LUZ60_011403 [Juncus effusus]|nr:hypothetical protein LUZ60_011403 [Juncus effusus]